MSIDSGQDAEVQKEAWMHEVQQERAEYLVPGVTREKFLGEYLNNVENVMPIPPGHEDVDLIGMNKRIALASNGDIKNIDLPYFHKGFNSKLMLSQTPNEFFAAIDGVLVDLGIDINQIGVLQHDMIAGGYEGFAQNKLKLLSLVEPAYVKLREMGYSRGDLIV